MTDSLAKKKMDFVGGAQNGAVIDVPVEQRYVDLPTRKEDGDLQRYERDHINFVGDRIEFFRLVDTTTADALRLLLACNRST